MRRAKWLLLLLPVLLFLSGCIETGYDKFVKNCPDEWTKRQVEAAYDYALKMAFMVKQDGGTYVIDRTKVGIEEASAVVSGVLGDINYVLSNENWRRLLNTMPSQRAAFEREEQRWLYIQSQLGQRKLYLDFLDMLGEGLGAEDTRYDIKYLLPQNTQFRFMCDYLEAARQAGSLKEVEREFVYLYTPYGEKAPDPAAPDDASAFVWKPKLQGFFIVSYAVLNDNKPRQLKADYCEVYRADLVGDKVQTESLPCARAFRKLTGSHLQVLVLDWDHEGDPGYGSIDAVKHVYASTGSDLYDTYTQYFKQLAESRRERAQEKRDYTIPPLDLQIVRAGETEEWRGDYNADGWSVPYRYKDEYGVNWTAKVIRDDSLPDGYPWKKIAYIIKVWADGAVWEYYRPQEWCSGDLEQVYAVGRNIKIQLKDDALQALSADQLCGELYQIIYKDGEEWVAIVDRDGTGRLQYIVRGVPDPSGSSGGAGAVSYEGNI